MKYRDYIFDLYGTLVDIRTDEESPALWAALAEYYCRQGAPCRTDELHEACRRLVSAAEQGAAPLRRDAHEAHPEIRLELVFQRLFRDRGVDADLEQAVRAGPLGSMKKQGARCGLLFLVSWRSRALCPFILHSRASSSRGRKEARSSP